MEKILIIKLGALGDVVMATSLIQQIQKHHSLEQSWLLTATPFDRLFENWKDLKTLSFNRKGFKDNLRILVWIRKQKFGRLYDLQSNDRTG
ncbi:MAG: glycosyltransferase family 9 protein, partial [Gammaproteobacteria bacterium]|nr:glycosyltransferase family 9 protein [Gammaproteobacteria bacterium]